MESENKIRQTINGLRKYQELISDLIKILEPIAKKYPSGGFISYSEPKWVPTTPNEFTKLHEEITEKALKKLGFDYGDFPSMLFVLNDETSFEMSYAETKWYGCIIQFDGKIKLERVYIPKDIKTILDVQLLIKSLSEDKN